MSYDGLVYGLLLMSYDGLVSIIKMIVAAFFSKIIKWGKRQHSLNK